MNDRTHSRCSYRSAVNSSDSPKSAALARIDSDTLISKQAIWTSATFLDHELFRAHNGSARTPLATRFIAGELRDNLPPYEVREQVLNYFFSYINTWISFIPEASLRQKFLLNTEPFDGEDLLLWACIHMVAQPLEEDHARTNTYMAIKSSFVNAEVHGLLSIRLLQAGILLLMYEFGHGLYPSAYLTQGTCMRCLAALDIDAHSQAPQYATTWLEAETRRRLWWAIFVLERSGDSYASGLLADTL